MRRVRVHREGPPDVAPGRRAVVRILLLPPGARLPGLDLLTETLEVELVPRRVAVEDPRDPALKIGVERFPAHHPGVKQLLGRLGDQVELEQAQGLRVVPVLHSKVDKERIRVADHASEEHGGPDGGHLRDRELGHAPRENDYEALTLETKLVGRVQNLPQGELRHDSVLVNHDQGCTHDGRTVALLADYFSDHARAVRAAHRERGAVVFLHGPREGDRRGLYPGPFFNDAPVPPIVQPRERFKRCRAHIHVEPQQSLVGGAVRRRHYLGGLVSGCTHSVHVTKSEIVQIFKERHERMRFPAPGIPGKYDRGGVLASKPQGRHPPYPFILHKGRVISQFSVHGLDCQRVSRVRVRRGESPDEGSEAAESFTLTHSVHRLSGRVFVNVTKLPSLYG
uniref:Non-structural core protein n=1 Tax=Latid herpesvirus 1 TaxID=3096545 RepID=A0AB33V6N2_9VIRU